LCLLRLFVAYFFLLNPRQSRTRKEVATKKHKRRKSKTEPNRLCLLRLFVAYFFLLNPRSNPYFGKRPRYSLATRNALTISAF
jgi:hypothetical protein